MKKYVILSMRVLISVIAIPLIILILLSPFFFLGRFILGNTVEALYYALYQMLSIVAVFIIATIYSGWRNKDNEGAASHDFLDVPVLIAIAVFLFNVIYINFCIKK